MVEAPKCAKAQEETSNKEAKKPKAKRPPRQKMPEQPSESRVRNFDDVPFGLTRRKSRARHVTFRVRKLGTGRRARRENTPSQIRHKPNRRLGLVCLARLFLREKEDLARL